MNNSLKFSSFLSFIAIVIVLLISSSTQEAHAQFGLFDTVWTSNYFQLSLNNGLVKSKDDSLLFLWKPNGYGQLTDTSQKFILVRTINIDDTLWQISHYPIRNLPLKFIENDSKILFYSRIHTTEENYINSCIKTRDAKTFEVTDSVEFDYLTYPANTHSCSKWFTGLSEIDTSIYYAGYCGATAIRGISYKVNYRTGQVKETSHILPYFAMTISEDGQHVAGVYYTGGTASNVPYNEVIEVRKISDYSVVFRKETKYCDWTPNFTPYHWVTGYKFKFSKDNKYLLHYFSGVFQIFDLQDKKRIYLKGNDNFSSVNRIVSFTNDSKGLFYSYVKLSYGIPYDVGYVLLKLENLKEKVFEFPNNKGIYEGGGAGEGLIFGSSFMLSSGTRISDKDYTNSKDFDISLAKLNFDLNSMQEPENPIQGTLFPNPTNMNLTLKLQLESPKTLSTSILNIEGYLIKEFGINQCEEGENILYFNASELSPGTYFLRITGERFSQTYKVIINR